MSNDETYIKRLEYIIENNKCVNFDNLDNDPEYIKTMTCNSCTVNKYCGLGTDLLHNNFNSLSLIAKNELFKIKLNKL